MSISECCLQGFKWEGTPTGHTGKLGANDTYIADSPSPSKSAILLIHDLFGWTFPNLRLLADHYAAETNATVYLPDFFGGEVLPFDAIAAERWADLDLPGYIGRNSREIREPEIFACARALRAKYEHVAAVGYCYGGWAVFRLGSEEGLVDCITAGHPSLLTKEDIEGVKVPVQMLAPEIDMAYPKEMKSYTFETLLSKNVTFDYQHFPGVVHACFVRGDQSQKGERAAMVRGKNAAVAWFKQFLA